MQLTINSNTIGIAVAFCMQLGALFWWASHIQTQQQNIIDQLKTKMYCKNNTMLLEKITLN